MITDSSPVPLRASRRPLSFCRPVITPSKAANDNGKGARDRIDLRSALACFSQHGLGAAAAARSNAEAAHYVGDGAERSRWLSICRSFDAAMARNCEIALGLD
ncbi:hypothetical protein GRI38_05990 [Altererythrobacter aurantiacus]|uniref:Uncharacterized protein n=1 Tax=Parapontixanthobacter aurantiacus TaxID=1463599 RepID=A0A844ZF04_9SPHN|nr:hypothetical protein [Parapontixanthobacter aurantiacus]MXO85577.1 hypothetical protein [Parapontixanthobacter aurantiacus]